MKLSKEKIIKFAADVTIGCPLISCIFCGIIAYTAATQGATGFAVIFGIPAVLGVAAYPLNYLDAKNSAKNT